MNILVDKLPTDYEGLKINTNFRSFILFELLMQDSQINKEDKIALALELFYEEFPHDIKKAVNGIIWFYTRGKKVKENVVIIEDGVAKLPDRSFFAGSIGTMDRAVRFAVKNCGFAIFDALKMASLTPAKLMQIDSYKGSIKLGKDADFVITDYDINVKNVYIKGEKAV